MRIITLFFFFWKIKEAHNGCLTVSLIPPERQVSKRGNVTTKSVKLFNNNLSALWHISFLDTEKYFVSKVHFKLAKMYNLCFKTATSLSLKGCPFIYHFSLNSHMAPDCQHTNKITV